MGMRLLPKSEVDRKKATEKRVEIDEGLKLARQIDNFRETKASEEVSLEKFRRETVAKIHEEITSEARKRDEIKQEVAIYEQNRAEALKPLTHLWESVKKASESVELRKNSVEAREIALQEHEKELAEIRKGADTLIRKAVITDAISNSRLHEAELEREETRKSLEAARVVKMETDQVRQELDRKFTHRESVVAKREDGVTIRETDLAAREKALADGWRLLKDRTALLERNIKRTL